MRFAGARRGAKACEAAFNVRGHPKPPSDQINPVLMPVNKIDAKVRDT